MTIINYFPDHCAVCGTEQKNQHLFYHLEHYPLLQRIYYELLGPDLTICTKCGYISNPISKRPGKVTREWLQSEEYLKNDGIDFKSFRAGVFYKNYKIELLNRRFGGAFCSIFETSLLCFVEKDFENATWCSFLALSLVDKLKRVQYIDQEKFSLMRAGLLRRTGQFQRLLTEYSECTFENKMNNSYLALLLEKAKQKDSGNIPDTELHEVLRWFEF